MRIENQVQLHNRRARQQPVFDVARGVVYPTMQQGQWFDARLPKSGWKIFGQKINGLVENGETMKRIAAIPRITPMTKPPTACVKADCPGCGHAAVFDQFNTLHDLVAENHSTRDAVIAGVRVCPDPNCRTILFFHLSGDANATTIDKMTLVTYPEAAIKLDKSDIPPPVLEAFQEALGCMQNGHHVAAALMVRKTIEEICHEQNIKGGNLEKRIDAFKQKVILPPALVDSLHDLRLLGNDAAHIESRNFNDVGPVELELSIKLVTELLKAMYQHQALQKQLAALKKPPSGTPSP